MADNYDPYMVPVEISEGHLADLDKAVETARWLIQVMQGGAAALDNGAEGYAMAAYFRTALANACGKSTILF
jgi:hypothetical protein